MKKSMKKQREETPLARCKEVLEDFLLNSKELCICSKNSRFYLNRDIVEYLIKTGYSEFLFDDVSGFQISYSVSERALRDFAKEEKVFDGQSGKYVIKEVYGEHSTRLFEAWPA